MEKFTKVKNIGKGNMGACALARNNEDGRFYVIKQVDLAKLNKKERQQSLNEAKLLSSLRHPNVINYVDSFLARKSDHLCIVMEFADGGDLSNKIKNQHGVNFPENNVLDWFIEMALSLHYVHLRKILHRDVKTQNVFLTQDGLCKLGDFGIARTLNSTYDQASTFVGTPYYLSPELILERPYDYMSDVWALGIVLYEMMGLKHPFNANDMKTLMHRILKVQYDPLPTCYSGELRGLIGKILVKDPIQRMRLGEVLELPIVLRRVREWMEGSIVPPKYLQALARIKQLPPALANLLAGLSDASPQHAAALPVIHRQSEDYSQGLGKLGPPRYETDDVAPLMQQGGRGQPSTYVLDPKPKQMPAPSYNIYQNHQSEKVPPVMPRRDPSLVDKSIFPPSSYYSPQPAQQQSGVQQASGVYMPRRDPGLLNPNVPAPQQQYRQPVPSSYQPTPLQQRLQPLAPEVAPNVNAYNRLAPPVTNAYVPQTYYTAGNQQRIQPSILPLSTSPVPGPAPAGQPSRPSIGGMNGGGGNGMPQPPGDAIQAMLQRAAQDRAMRQQQQNRH